MDRSLHLQSIPGLGVDLLGGNEPYEHGQSRLTLALAVQDVKTKELIGLSLELTVEQVVWLVKQFFFCLFAEKRNIYTEHLRRLLRKRWAVKTAVTCKDRRLDGFWLPPYDRNGILD